MLFKHIRHMFNPFQEHERLEFKKKIIFNVLTNAQSIASGVFELCIPWAYEENIKTAQEIVSIDSDEAMNFPENTFSKLKHGIAAMWEDPAVCVLLRSTHRHSELQFCRSLHYVMPRLNIIMKPDYVPSVQDVFHTRGTTTGVIGNEVSLKIGNSIEVFEICDLGGRRGGKMQM
jgi:hypothetical protein